MKTAEELMGRVSLVGDCYRWAGYVRKDGYAVVTRQSGGKTEAAYVHRLMYEQVVGPIPEGYDLDHTCHDPHACKPGRSCPHRRCINPSHLQPVTRRVNTLRSGSPTAENGRKTHCKHGHEFTPENTERRPGGRGCRECSRAKCRRQSAARRAAAREAAAA